MRVLMLGWEYPPHISGGLGTACEGLTVALARLGTEILFVVPRVYGNEPASHMKLVDPFLTKGGKNRIERQEEIVREKAKITTVGISSVLRPYMGAAQTSYLEQLLDNVSSGDRERLRALGLFDTEESLNVATAPKPFEPYGFNIFEEIDRYTAQLVASFSHEPFDIIHGHDWMTFPAAVALKQLSGKRMVLHVHSLEVDRSGQATNYHIEQIERFGLENADQIIAVSHFTKKLIIERHGISEDKIVVVHNGVYPKVAKQLYRRQSSLPDKIVLFLGRVTYQKGPDYFVEAAARVVAQVPDVLFVMAGSGDMLPQMKKRVEELNLSDHFLFTGFLRGEEVEKVFSIADLYVMPSVSEPFGISALEAISYQTPVIISKQSGVAEVLRHALKVDFWDVDRMADLITNALIHEELRQDMVKMAYEEVRRIHWDAAALKVKDIYLSE
jgi:glycosyltransferase involved in cell wall biosynthesis